MSVSSPAMDEQEIAEIVTRALAEDVGAGDVTTTATVPAELRARAVITQKAPGVVFGLEVAEARSSGRSIPDVVLRRLGPEGEWREGGPVLGWSGSARALLSAERTALNFLQRLSGVATLTARCVGRSRAPAPGSSTRARPLPGCARSRRRPSRPAAAPTTAPACTTRS